MGRRVWKSSRGDYWNMICAVGPNGNATVGGGPWARYRSDTPTLMKWRKADDVFTLSAETGKPQPVGCQSGAYFQPIPNPKPGGPTHMINSGSAGPMLLVAGGTAHTQPVLHSPQQKVVR